MAPRIKPKGITIDTFRRVNHLSTSELARRAAVSRQYMSRIQAGHRGASLAVLKRIADALNVQVEAISEEVEQI